ncbi:hypothetical protein B0H13DRAFT_1884163 [Mycena leptocephala]|nr:hypothetical protein B0H13DRAFT_1884163 [Mycena leptocephala]
MPPHKPHIWDTIVAEYVAEDWSNAQDLVSISLHDLGLRIHLGHDGQPCPRPDGRHLILISRLGRSIVSVDFCTCDQGPGEGMQLLEIGWIQTDPNTCVALEVVDTGASSVDAPFGRIFQGAPLDPRRGRRIGPARCFGPLDAVKRDVDRPRVRIIHEGPPSSIYVPHMTSGLLGVPLTEEQHRQNYLRRLKMDLRVSSSMSGKDPGRQLTGQPKAVRRRREQPTTSHHPKPAAKPLTHEDLWLDNVRPPVDVAPNYEHKCGICLGIKSHPVVGKRVGLKINTKKGYEAVGAPVPGAYHVHPRAPHAEVLSTSADGRRATAIPATIHTRPEVPSYFQDDAETNAALEAEDFSYIMGDTSLPVEEQEPEVVVAAAPKRKRNANSDSQDHPLQEWKKHRDEYLDEMLRLEGRGPPDAHGTCLSCGMGEPTFCCAQQLCHGEGMFCAACIVQQHACLPMHWIEEWNGEYFDRTSLYVLGLVVQLGHPPGFSCATSTPGHKDFVMIDLSGVHTVRVHFCECDSRILHRQQLMRVRWWPATAKNPKTCVTFAVLRQFQLLNCSGKVSAHDFVGSLELLTNNDGLTPPPFRTTLMMKRAGRGHAESGVAGTSQGELALRCRACPQDGRNLPDGWDKIKWEEMPEDLRDPIIGDGLGYFVNHAKYTEFLRAHVSEEEISSCSGFQAMFLANKKRVKGLRTTGVGGVTCARHNMWRPNGIGDLQLGNELLEPNAVAPGGIPHTHGCGPRLNWEFTNGAAASTKMMGLGSRHATLEDLFGFHNWRRLVSWRGIFTKRMKENVTEGQGWQKWVHEWESKQHKDNAASPFEVKEKVATMKEIRLSLAKEELVRSGEGEEVEREDTPSTFLMMGLEIEESQRHLAIDVKAISNPTSAQELDFLKRRTAISKPHYMPNVRKFLTASQRTLWDSEADREAEAIRLFLPSDIADQTKRIKACAEGLPEVEGRLREGEAHTALETLRKGLRVRTMTNRYRVRNATGQRALTRGQGVLRQNNVRIHKAKFRYRYARNALSRVRGNGEWERVLRVLEDSDVRALNERALTDEEKAQRGAVHDLHDVEEGGMAIQGNRPRKSWWKVSPSKFGFARADNEGLCTDASMARRCGPGGGRNGPHIQYGYWEAGEWLQRSVARENQVDPVLGEGLKAYTLEQAHREAKTCDALKSRWAHWRERGQLYLVRATQSSQTVLAPMEANVSDDEGEDDEEDEAPPDYEDEEDDALE